MREAILVVVGIVALLATASIEPTLAIRGGLLVSIAFVLLGSVAGAVYHRRLHRCLSARGDLPPRWWLDPTTLHVRLTDDERVGVMPPFYLGAAAFGFCVLGCVAMVSGLVRLLL